MNKNESWILIVMALAGCSGDPSDSLPPSEPEESAVVVPIATPPQREVVEWADFTGRLQPVDFVEIRSRVSGYLQSVEFEEGDLVEAGDLLFVVDPRPFEAAVETAQANLDEAIAKEEGANARLRTAEANQATAVAEEEYAEIQLARQQQLEEQNATAQSEVDLARNNYLKASAQVQAAEAQIAEAKAAISTAKAAIATAEAAKREADLNLLYTKITAPVSGRISRRNVTEGNLISGGSEQSVVLTTIVSLDPVYVVFDASEQEVLRFQRLVLQGARQSARDVKYPVYMRLEDEEGYPHEGFLDFVDNRLDPETATLTARAEFDNPDGLLTPGMFAKLRIAETPPFMANLLPDSAIGTDQTEQFVYVVDAENRARMRPVETGSLFDGLRIIREGIESDDRVVIGGLQRIREGALVAAKPTEVEILEEEENSDAAESSETEPNRSPAEAAE